MTAGGNCTSEELKDLNKAALVVYQRVRTLMLLNTPKSIKSLELFRNSGKKILLL